MLTLLRQYQLLPPTALSELETFALRHPEPGALAHEVLRRGWLTPYQVDCLLHNRPTDLVLGDYLLLELLGQGGVGQVFKARHRQSGQLVAIKVLHAEYVKNRRAVERFQREIAAVTRLAHPNIVQALAAQENRAGPCLVMEYVPGTDLSSHVKRHGPLPPADACDYIRQAALGLQHAHEHGLVHRDIKPGNLLLTISPQGQAPVIKILDFGLTRFAEETSEEGRLTRLGSVLGTVDYVAPEQAENARTADARCDIYSLGCSLYYLLTGQPPFSGADAVERLTARLLGPPPPLRQTCPQAPPELERVLSRMLAREPADRYQTAAEAAQALAPFAHPSRPRRRLALAVAAGLLVVFLVWLLVAPRGSQPPASSPPELVLKPDAGKGPAESTPSPPTKPAKKDRDKKPLPKAWENSVGMKLVWIKPGDFLMGSPPSEMGRDDEIPRPVTLTRGFYMAIHPVTQKQWQRVMGENPSPPHFMGDDLPVLNVSWVDCKEFARKLSDSEGRIYRLPSEAQWEYACRAGTTTAYHFGDEARDLGDHAWFADNSKGKVHPVGLKKPNAWGLHDMHGNVWQWCADYYGPYNTLPGTDPVRKTPLTEKNVVLRGGSASSTAFHCRAAMRMHNVGSLLSDQVGCRVICLSTR